jgi:hypothetical protein
MCHILQTGPIGLIHVSNIGSKFKMPDAFYANFTDLLKMLVFMPLNWVSNPTIICEKN